MDIGVITAISFILAIFSAVAQIINIFPKYNTYLKYAAFLFLGTTFGIIIGALQKSSLNIDFPFAGISLLAGSIILIIFCSVLIGAFTNDEKRRNELFIVSLVGMCLLVVILAGHCFAEKVEPAQSYSYDEIEILAEDNLKRGNRGRAISLYEVLLKRLEPNDLRKKFINEKIEDIKKQNSKVE